MKLFIQGSQLLECKNGLEPLECHVNNPNVSARPYILLNFIGTRRARATLGRVKPAKCPLMYILGICDPFVCGYDQLGDCRVAVMKQVVLATDRSHQLVAIEIQARENIPKCLSNLFTGALVLARNLLLVHYDPRYELVSMETSTVSCFSLSNLSKSLKGNRQAIDSFTTTCHDVSFEAIVDKLQVQVDRVLHYCIPDLLLRTALHGSASMPGFTRYLKGQVVQILETCNLGRVRIDFIVENTVHVGLCERSFCKSLEKKLAMALSTENIDLVDAKANAYSNLPECLFKLVLLSTPPEKWFITNVAISPR